MAAPAVAAWSPLVGLPSQFAPNTFANGIGLGKSLIPLTVTKTTITAAQIKAFANSSGTDITVVMFVSGKTLVPIFASLSSTFVTTAMTGGANLNLLWNSSGTRTTITSIPATIITSCVSTPTNQFATADLLVNSTGNLSNYASASIVVNTGAIGTYITGDTTLTITVVSYTV